MRGEVEIVKNAWKKTGYEWFVNDKGGEWVVGGIEEELADGGEGVVEENEEVFADGGEGGVGGLEGFA